MKPLATIAAGLAAALSLAACATYDQAAVESTIQGDLSKEVEDLTGSKIESAQCPAEVEGFEKGATFECTATLEDGKDLRVDGVVANDSGDYRVDIAPEEIRGAVGSG